MQNLTERPLPRILRTSPLLLGVATILITTLSANAGQTPFPKFGELPVGRVTQPPQDSKPPSAIGGNESVAGMYAATRNGGGNQKVVYVGADSVVRDQNFAIQTLDPATGCYAAQIVTPGLQPQMLSSFEDSEIGMLGSAFTSTTRSPEWDQTMSFQATLWPNVEGPRVHAVHGERVIERGASDASLESTDAWVDSGSRGLRLISKATLPLKQVGSAPGGVRIFAGRDDRGDGRSFVQFVVLRAKNTPYQPAASVFGTRSDGSVTSSGGCAHHRLALRVTKNAETGTLQFTTVLPDLGPNEHSSAQPLPPASAFGQQSKDYRTRPVRASFSVSQTSRDKEPVLSVATSWAGPEVFQRVFTPVQPSPPMTVTSPGKKAPNKASKRIADPGF